MNWKTCFLSLLLAAAVLGSVTAFADGEPVTPETTEPTEITSEETAGSWSGNTYTDAQGITYQLNGDSITVTGTSTNFSGGAITIPDAIEKGEESYPVTRVGGTAFASCWQLVSVTFSGNVGSIGGTAFQDCNALKTVTFSGNVGSIGDSAFWDCTALKTLTFSGDVGFIGTNAFRNCDSLESVTFSGDVGSIDIFAFQNCNALTTIYVPASMPEETVQIIRDALKSSELFDVKIERSAPEQPSDPDPDTPSDPATGTPSTPSTGTTSTGSAVQQLEAAERPDPMDVEATERYNFWMDVKSDLRAAENGEKVRVHVPSDYTNMPASVMETLRTLETDVALDLRWGGERLLITPQTALKRPPLKAFWTLSQLCEQYAR